MNIAIFFGGKSIEHDVSVVTAKQIYSIAKGAYEVSLIYVDKNGNLNLYTNPEFDLKDFKGDSRFFKSIIIHNGYVFYK